MKKRTTKKRPDNIHSSDHYQTPDEAVDILLLFIDSTWRIWEPFCGKGNIVRFFQRKHVQCVGTDILTGTDFLTCDVPANIDAIISNPPFSIKDKVLERCYEIGKPFALLMPLAALEGKKRQRLYSEHGIQPIFFDTSVKYETPSGKRSSPHFATAWFCWGFHAPGIATLNRYNFCLLKRPPKRKSDGRNHRIGSA